MKRRKRKPPRRRNVYAATVRRYGHRIEPSGKLYKRRTKHRNPCQPHDGGFHLDRPERGAIKSSGGSHVLSG